MMPAITGTVRKAGQPLGGAYVRLVGPSGEFVAERYTQDDGGFAFHVLEGTWTIEARAAHAETEKQPVEIGESDAAVDIELSSN